MNVWVFVEETNGAPAPAGLELLTKARDLGDTAAVLLGQDQAAVADLGRSGAGTVFTLTGDDGTLPAAGAAAAMAELAAAEAPDLIMFALSYTDRELAGRLIARLGRPVV